MQFSNNVLILHLQLNIRSNHEVFPFQMRTKAGNVNAWLDHVKHRRYEFFMQLDIDHIPLPTYLDKTYPFLFVYLLPQRRQYPTKHSGFVSTSTHLLNNIVISYIYWFWCTPGYIWVFMFKINMYMQLIIYL